MASEIKNFLRLQQDVLPNTVLPNCMLFCGTVPTNGVLFGWTVLPNSFPLIVYQILKSSGICDICFQIKTIRGSYSEKFLKLYQFCLNLYILLSNYFFAKLGPNLKSNFAWILQVLTCKLGHAVALFCRCRPPTHRISQNPTLT